MPDPAPFDHSRAAAFEERLVGALNPGALCLMTSVGHRAGLFDAMADLPAAGSEAIAARSGQNERYVREWLGAMVAGGFWITTRGTAPTPSARTRKDVRLVSRNQIDFGNDYAQLIDHLKLITAKNVVIDGEITALDKNGKTSFQLLNRTEPASEPR